MNNDSFIVLTDTKKWKKTKLCLITVVIPFLLLEIIMLIIIPPVARHLLFIGAGDASLGDAVNTIGTKTPDGVYYKLLNGSSTHSQIIVINFHGNYQSITLPTNDFFSKLKSDIYALYDVEYRGYANVPGSPNEKSLSVDLQNVIQWISKKHPDKQIILSGYSVGASLVLFNLHNIRNKVSGAVVFHHFPH